MLGFIVQGDDTYNYDDNIIHWGKTNNDINDEFTDTEAFILRITKVDHSIGTIFCAVLFLPCF